MRFAFGIKGLRSVQVTPRINPELHWLWQLPRGDTKMPFSPVTLKAAAALICCNNSPWKLTLLTSVMKREHAWLLVYPSDLSDLEPSMGIRHSCSRSPSGRRCNGEIWGALAPSPTSMRDWIPQWGTVTVGGRAVEEALEKEGESNHIQAGRNWEGKAVQWAAYWWWGLRLWIEAWGHRDMGTAFVWALGRLSSSLWF